MHILTRQIWNGGGGRKGNHNSLKHTFWEINSSIFCIISWKFFLLRNFLMLKNLLQLLRRAFTFSDTDHTKSGSYKWRLWRLRGNKTETKHFGLFSTQWSKEVPVMTVLPWWCQRWKRFLTCLLGKIWRWKENRS